MKTAASLVDFNTILLMSWHWLNLVYQSEGKLAM